jgi:hypothetical protein
VIAPALRRVAAFALVSALASLGACAATSAERGDEEGMGTWEDALGFDKDSVLSDAEFTDSNALSSGQIQAFLEHTHCGYRSSLADYVDPTSGLSAAQMIANASAKYIISPVEFLVRLQVERSMLCKAVDTYAIEHALSCGCPDGAPCASVYAGFDRQVQCAGSHFRKYLDDVAATGHTTSGWAPHKTKNSSDPIAVTPSNAATAALYTYTPWVYNGGNQLHYQVWNAITKSLGTKPSGTVPETKKPIGSTPPPSGASAAAVPRGCTSDAECNHGVLHTGTVCANSGPERGNCIDACHADTDCPTGGTCDATVLPHSQCTNAPPATGTRCTVDADCTGGTAGSSRVCSTDSHTCIVGCHADDDCGAGAGGKKGICDRGLRTWQCVYRNEIGDKCSSDTDCNGGVGGTARVCDDTLHLCIDACRTDADCDAKSTCEWPGGEPIGICLYDPTRENTAPARAPNGCPALAFPSGVKIQTVRDAVLEAAYANHVESGKKAPTCFIDVDNLVDPDTGAKLEYATVRLSDHFTLRELVGTEISQGWGRRVLLEPSAVESLENFRRSEGRAFSPTSGYRSPLHQEATCKAICGQKWCPGHCAQYSRHLWGDAFDLPLQFYSYKYAQLACDAGFNFAYNEAHNHLHVDMNPRSASCVIQFD